VQFIVAAQQFQRDFELTQLWHFFFEPLTRGAYIILLTNNDSTPLSFIQPTTSMRKAPEGMSDSSSKEDHIQHIDEYAGMDTITIHPNAWSKYR
jgi:hypothetical protein